MSECGVRYKQAQYSDPASLSLAFACVWQAADSEQNLLLKGNKLLSAGIRLSVGI